MLLRAAAGGTATIQGGLYFSGAGNSSLSSGMAGLMAMAAGFSLLIGFVTPVASIMIAIGAIATALSWLPSPAVNLLDTALPAVLITVVAAAVAFLGPGGLSVDARLFGRREIIIPLASRSTKP